MRIDRCREGEQGIQTVMILDMGARLTKLYIVERGVLRASHIINKGSQDITLALSQALSISVNEAENLKRVHGLKGGPEQKELTEIITVNLDYIFYEANTTLLNYQRKYSKNISKVILTGGGVLLKGFIDLAKISFQSDIVYADPFGRLESPAFLEQEFKEAGPEFSVAIGIALRKLSENG
jgi:type IV pilus assembly protein PilM